MAQFSLSFLKCVLGKCHYSIAILHKAYWSEFDKDLCSAIVEHKSNISYLCVLFQSNWRCNLKNTTSVYKQPQVFVERAQIEIEKVLSLEIKFAHE